MNMSALGDRCVLPDANTVIQMLRRGVREKILTDLCVANRMRIVDDVARELRQRDGQCKTWIAANPSFVLHPVQQVLDEVGRLAREHGTLFSTAGKAADPALVATALYYKTASPQRLVVSEDNGVMAVCLLEGLEFLPNGAFFKLFGI